MSWKWDLNLKRIQHFNQMKKLYFLILFVLISITSLRAQLVQQQIIAGELPDPSIIEVDGTYYVTGSSNDWAPYYPIYKSVDLKNWEFVNYVFGQKPDWTINSYWAPELFYHNDTFYCYYTARRTDGTSVIGVATTKDISKGFKDEGEIIAWGNEAIDACVYEEGDQLYITWKAYGLNPDKPIQILGSQLTDDGLKLKGEAFNILTADVTNWEKGGVEGQCIIKNGEYLYMLYSGNACCGAGCDYQVGVARAKSMTGPWEKYDQNPILTGTEAYKCPGHGTAIHTKNDWYYVYHAYPEAGFPYLGRTVLLSEISWNEVEWPIFNQNENASAVSEVHGDFIDDFDAEELDGRWRTNVTEASANVQLSKGKLIFSDIQSKVSDNSISFLGINPDSDAFTFQTEIKQPHDLLQGIAMYVTNDNSIGLGVAGSKVVLWKIGNGKFTELNSIDLETKGAIELKAEVVDAHKMHFSYRNGKGKWTDIPDVLNNSLEVVGDNLGWWSWGIKVGIFASKTNNSTIKGAAFESFSLAE